MNKTSLAAALLIIIAVTGGLLTALGGETEVLNTLKILPTEIPEKPAVIENPDEVIETTVTGIRGNGAMLYVEYYAKIGGEEVKGSIDAPLTADAETIMQLIQSDVLKKEQTTKNEAAAIDLGAIIGTNDVSTRQELYDKFYPVEEPTLVEEIEITP